MSVAPLRGGHNFGGFCPRTAHHLLHERDEKRGLVFIRWTSLRDVV